MKLDPRAWVLLALGALAVAGLKLPGLLGEVGVYVWLGVFPGMALARLLLPRAAASTRWTLGLTLSPVVSAVAGWAMLRGGMDLVTGSRVAGIAGFLLFAGGEARGIGMPADDPQAAPLRRFVLVWTGAAVLFVVAVLALNPWSLIRSDTWVHLAIVQVAVREAQLGRGQALGALQQARVNCRPACGQLAGMQQPFVMAHPSGHPPEQWHLACCLGHWLVDRLQYEADRLSCS